MNELNDYIGEVIAVLALCFTIWKFSRDRTKDKDEQFRREAAARETSAEEHGENKQWKLQVERKLEDRKTEIKELMNEMDTRLTGMESRYSTEIQRLRDEIHNEFKSTDTLLNNFMGEVRQLKGRLEGQQAAHE